MERVRLVGIARGPAQVLVQRTVVADDQGAFGRIDVLDPFDIELDDGRRLRVEPTKDARIEPLREEKIAWGEIEDDPSFAALREKGPGPHVTVHVKRRAVCDGDRVALDGEERDFTFEQEDAATMRTAPVRRLSSVSADVLASGADAEAILARALDETPEKTREKLKEKKKTEQKAKKQREETKRALRAEITVPRVCVAIAIVLFLFSLTMRTSPAFVDFVVTSIALVGMSVTLASWRRLPRFVRGKLLVEDQGGQMGVAGIVGAMLFLTIAFMSAIGDLKYAWDPAPRDVHESNVSWIVGVGAAIYLVVIGVMYVRSTRKRASLLSTLLSAPPFESIPAGAKWGSVDGVVRDPTPVSVDGAQRALANVVDREVRPGSDPDIVTETVLNKGTFFVDVHFGSFEIDPTSATWASAVRIVSRDTEDKHTFADVVVIGGRVLVAGRAGKPEKGKRARFVAGRSESLVFYATGRDVDPRAKVRAILARRTFTIATLFVLAAAVGGVMAHYEPLLPSFHMEGD